MDALPTPEHVVCALGALLVHIERVVKFRGADSLNMLYFLTRKWNKVARSIPEELINGPKSIGWQLFQEIDRVAGACLKKFFQRTINGEEQEREEKFITVLAKHMMKKCYNPTGKTSKAFQFADDALDDSDEFVTTSNGRQLQQLLLGGNWSTDASDLVEAIMFRCELDPNLSMFLLMKVLQLGTQISQNPAVFGSLAQAIAHSGFQPESAFCALAAIFAFVGKAISGGEGPSAVYMLALTTDVWNQLQVSLDVEGAAEFMQELESAWIKAADVYIQNKGAKDDSDIGKHVYDNLVKNKSLEKLFENLYNPLETESVAAKELAALDYLNA